LKFKIIKNSRDTEQRKQVAQLIKEGLEEVARVGGEGWIIRYAPCPYEFKRSKYLLKAKNYIDAEFEVEEAQEGHGNWAGCAKRIVLKLPKPVTDRNGKTVTNFASNIEGNKAYLQKMWRERDKVVGLPATCKFQCYSEYGIPTGNPVIEIIRNYE
jgi:ATP-dependent DNA ligase